MYNSPSNRLTNPQLDARRLASGLAMSLGRSPFERGSRKLTAALLGEGQPAQPAAESAGARREARTTDEPAAAVAEEDLRRPVIVVSKGRRPATNER